MTSHPDKVFRGGLEHYRKPAPASAWERIEANIDHKRNRGQWIKIAAGLLLLLGASFLTWQFSEQSDVNNTPLAIGKEQGAGSKVQGAVIAELSGEDERNEVDASATDSLESLAMNTIAEQSRNNLHSVVPENLAVVEKSRNEPGEDNQQKLYSSREPGFVRTESTRVTLIEPEEKMAEPIQVNQVEVANELAANDIVREQKGTNMMYSAEEVNEKFMKKELVADATPEKKNTSGLQKVIDRALDLRYEESVLAELREKKNEWLSLNIPSKQRETNK